MPATRPAPSAPPARAGGPPPIDPADPALLKWCRAVARGVARCYGFGPGSQEAADVEQVGYLALLRCVKAFDAERVPAGGDAGEQLRGYAHPSVRGECRREARRIRNGGTYHTKRPGPVPADLVAPLSDLAEDDGAEFEVADRGEGPPAADPPPLLLGTVRRRDLARLSDPPAG